MQRKLAADVSTRGFGSTADLQDAHRYLDGE